MSYSTSYYYASASGQSTGGYDKWDDCGDQVHQYSWCDLKKFESRAGTEDFVQTGSSSYSYERSRSSDSFTIRDSICYTSRSHGSLGSGFQRDRAGCVDVNTEGACASNGREGAQADVGVWFNDESSHNVSKPAEGPASNNNAETRAATEAAEQAQRAGVEKLTIHTDSQFFKNCNDEWMPQWKENGWFTSKEEPVKNKQELMKMERGFEPLDMESKYVPGHKGDDGNEQADELACAGARKR